jgi:SnoaL-like polyketide cyclase
MRKRQGDAHFPVLSLAGSSISSQRENSTGAFPHLNYEFAKGDPQKWFRIEDKNRSLALRTVKYPFLQVIERFRCSPKLKKGHFSMSKEEDNKAVVVRWFTEFWGADVNLAVIDEIAAPDMLPQYSLHEPRCGRDDIKAFMTDFRAAFPDLDSALWLTTC